MKLIKISAMWCPACLIMRSRMSKLDLNIEQVVNLQGYVMDNNNTYTIPINCYERSDFYNRVYFQNTNSSIYIGNSGYYPYYVSWVITIEYTKTTDIL